MVYLLTYSTLISKFFWSHVGTNGVNVLVQERRLYHLIHIHSGQPNISRLDYLLRYNSYTVFGAGLTRKKGFTWVCSVCKKYHFLQVNNTATLLSVCLVSKEEEEVTAGKAIVTCHHSHPRLSSTELSKFHFLVLELTLFPPSLFYDYVFSTLLRLVVALWEGVERGTFSKKCQPRGTKWLQRENRADSCEIQKISLLFCKHFIRISPEGTFCSWQILESCTKKVGDVENGEDCHL